MSLPINEVVWVNDLDRNLLDTNAAFDCFVNTCVGEGIVQLGDLAHARQQVELSGGTFDLTTYLEQQGVDADTLQDLYDIFSESAPKERLLYPDAREFLARLALEEAPVMVLTYGNTAWQLAKLKAAGLEHSNYLITPYQHKGRLIAGWQQGAGFRISCDNDVALEGRTVCLTDDKAISFKGLPEVCRGFLVRREAKKLVSQTGQVSDNVLTVRSMDEIHISPHL